MLKVGIIGASGYTGGELIRILLRHKGVRITYLARGRDTGERIEEIFPWLKNILSMECGGVKLSGIKECCDLVFMSLPHGLAASYVPAILKYGKRVIDLSADYRFNSAAVYGLPELNREKIKGARLIANPGCYATAAILSLAPLVAGSLVEPGSLIVDAKSGVSGAGKRQELEYSFSESNENFKAYKVACHRHNPEINQALSRLSRHKASVTFVPHLLPLNRGIYVSAYARLKHSKSAAALTAIYEKFYKREPFIRVLGGDTLPEIKNVVNTNFCDIAIRVSPKDRTVIVLGAIDNLVKGASGQAVQNMNIMHGFPETEALV
ncbi:MAG: N-acetyl-gamma-glutamyl-phosphate reductase [Candidatus Omnitrophica bacterium]|nr:N-acetyl-gamma-glutamyl-phosphate reductase [Candidatus Omnitrophota bacterium]